MADTDQVLNLAAIIREVDGNNRKGAAALAESILDHPRFRAALADGPAVPEGREPASVVSEPTYDDLSELCSQHGLDVDSWPLEKFDALWETARAVLARWGTPNFAETRSLLRDAPQPVPVSERLPVGVEQALIKAECALSDIAEGEPEENEGDADACLQWAEQRAATALSRIRPVMRLHGILTSEWPPLPAHALPVPGQEVR